jgi:hypothetical protein
MSGVGQLLLMGALVVQMKLLVMLAAAAVAQRCVSFCTRSCGAPGIKPTQCPAAVIMRPCCAASGCGAAAATCKLLL